VLQITTTITAGVLVVTINKTIASWMGGSPHAPVYDRRHEGWPMRGYDHWIISEFNIARNIE
jgi:hypothetical protein